MLWCFGALVVSLQDGGRAFPDKFSLCGKELPTLEVTQGQILSQTSTDTTRFWWHFAGFDDHENEFRDHECEQSSRAGNFMIMSMSENHELGIFMIMSMSSSFHKFCS